MADRYPVLTVAIPVYNMERYLPQTLQSLLRVNNDNLQVLILDNNSDDSSGQIADEFARVHPQRFTVIHKDNHGYGSSINQAIVQSTGRYLRIVDADDWVDSRELGALLHKLKTCVADLVLCDYTTVDDQTGVQTHIDVRPKGFNSGICYPVRNDLTPYPQMHATIFRTQFLRECAISLLEDTFYVDEQLMILACLHASSFVYYSYDIYRYRVGRVAQSVNALSMGRLYEDRERELKNCLDSYKKWAATHGPSFPCLQELSRQTGNHFTTHFLYVEPPALGRALARQWLSFLKEYWPELAWKTAGKRNILALMNRLHLGGKRYLRLRTLLHK